LAGTIADASVRSEYQSEFRRRFDALFTPVRRAFVPFEKRGKGQWKPPAGPVDTGAKAVNAAGIDRVLAKAVLAGLIRHPAEIARHTEVLASLRLADGALGRLFEAVVDLALEDQALDSARLVTILARSGFDTVAGELLRADSMPYSFTQATADPIRACEDLDEAIAVLVAGPEVNAALADATAAMQADFTADAFDRQVAAVKEKAALELRLANLVQANEDARALGPEGN
jgi:DNA primase